MKTIEEFLASGRASAWLKIGSFEVYVRRAYHACGEEGCRTFDIANVHSNRATGSGTYRPFIAGIIQLLETRPDLRGDITHVYFENILNPKLVPLYKEFGAVLALNVWPESYYLKLKGV